MDLKIENWESLVLSVFYMIFSILSYIAERERFLDFFQIAEAVIILVDLLQILVYFFKKEYIKPNEFSFSFGVIYCIAGPIVATKSYLITDNHPITISALVILDATLCSQYSMNLFRLEDTQWRIHLTLTVIPLFIGMVLILVSSEEETLHNLFNLLPILDIIANSYTTLYYRGVARRYGRHSEQILDISNQEATAHEVADGKDSMVW